MTKYDKDMKKNTKKFKPVFTVDFTDCVTLEDAQYAMAEAKYNAGLDLAKRDVKAFVNRKVEDAIDLTVELLFDGHNACIIDDNGDYLQFDAVKVEVKEKKPWYKRIFSWGK